MEAHYKHFTLCRAGSKRFLSIFSSEVQLWLVNHKSYKVYKSVSNL